MFVFQIIVQLPGYTELSDFPELLLSVYTSKISFNVCKTCETCLDLKSVSLLVSSGCRLGIDDGAECRTFARCGSSMIDPHQTTQFFKRCYLLHRKTRLKTILFETTNMPHHDMITDGVDDLSQISGQVFKSCEH